LFRIRIKHYVSGHIIRIKHYVSGLLRHSLYLFLYEIIRNKPCFAGFLSLVNYSYLGVLLSVLRFNVPCKPSVDDLLLPVFIVDELLLGILRIVINTFGLPTPPGLPF
jgi:hypothetical protein